MLIKEENKSCMLWRKGLVTKLIKSKENLIRGAELKVCQPSLSRSKHINRPLQLLVPLEVTQERTLDEKETVNRKATFDSSVIFAPNNNIIQSNSFLFNVWNQS